MGAGKLYPVTGHVRLMYLNVPFFGEVKLRHNYFLARAWAIYSVFQNYPEVVVPANYKTRYSSVALLIFFYLMDPGETE